MAEESLRITITADNKDAVKKIQDTILALDGVEKAGKSAGGATQKLGKDFTGISRVIQDLPYGFNAIANNLTNILPAAGALGLGISALVAGLQFAQLGFGAWTRGLGEATKATEEAEKANEDYRSSLAKEKTQLDLLFRSATNANIPMAVRLDAVKQLRENYGAYLTDFSNEEILAGKATSAYEKLSTAIIKSAKAKAASNLITKKQEEVLKLEQANADALRLAEEERASIKGAKQLNLGNISGAQYSQANVSMAQQFLMVQNGLNKTLNENNTAITKLKEEMDLLGKEYDNNTVKLTTNTEEVKKGNVELDKNIKLRQSLHGKMLEESMRLDALSLVAPEDKAAAAIKPPDPSKLGELEFLMNKKAYQDDYNKTLEVANNLTNTAMNSINGLVTSMQQGQSIGEAFGNMFKNLAIQIALAAAKAAIFTGILSLLPGGTEGAAAAKKEGTEAGGGGFFKMFKSLLGFSEGGTVSGPKSGYPVMLHGTEHIVRPDQMRSIIASASQMGGGNSRVIVEGRISGQDIWLSQQRTSVYRGLTT
ncbi:MAG: hypothetical protein ACK52I_11645 [Pseudomonadota bacterium]